MQASYLIARIAGPVIATLGIGVLINGQAYGEVSRQMLGNSALVAFSGVLMLIVGLVILNAHPRWTADWRSLVTGLGWFLALIGVFRIFAPDLVRFVGASGHVPFVTAAAVVFVAVGGFLTFKGYGIDMPASGHAHRQRRELKS